VGTATDIFKSLRGVTSFLDFTSVGIFYVGNPYGGNSFVLEDKASSTSIEVEAQDGGAGTGVAVCGERNGDGWAEPTVSPIKTIPYQAPGRDSERREYADGEAVTIDSEAKVCVLAWSAEIGAPDFLRFVGQLVNASSVKLEYGVERPRRRALSKALKMVAGRPEVDAIQVDVGDDSFMWSSTDIWALDRQDLRRVSMAFSALDPARVEGLIAETAATEIKGDLAGIIASVDHLTHTASPAAAA
jgi:hypothetical protein